MAYIASGKLLGNVQYFKKIFKNLICKNFLSGKADTEII